MASKPKSSLTDAQRRLQLVLDAASQSAIAYAGPTVPELGNLTPEGLNEEFGRLNDARKAIEKVEKIVKERLKSQLDGRKHLRSDNYDLKIESAARVALDQSAAKAKLLELGGQEALDACMAETMVERVTIKALF